MSRTIKPTLNAFGFVSKSPRSSKRLGPSRVYEVAFAQIDQSIAGVMPRSVERIEDTPARRTGTRDASYYQFREVLSVRRRCRTIALACDYAAAGRYLRHHRLRHSAGRRSAITESSRSYERLLDQTSDRRLDAVCSTLWREPQRTAPGLLHNPMRGGVALCGSAEPALSACDRIKDRARRHE